MLAVIGGTGLAQLAGLQHSTQAEVETPFGKAVFQKGELNGFTLLFLSRHGHPPDTPPHKINYRANIWALKKEKVSGIIAVTAVGSVNPELQVGDLVINDQIIDYTYGRDFTFYDDEIHHIDFTYPFDQTLRTALINSAEHCALDDEAFRFHPEGCYGCTQGPRLETAAEIRKLGIDGCDVVGMTAMPEAALAREMDLPYSGLSFVVNKGAGLDPVPLDMAEIAASLSLGSERAIKVLIGALPKLG